MEAETYKRIHPSDYYRSFLSQNIRPDGRTFNGFRPITITANSVGTADGSSIVKLGKTTVVCGIKAEIAVPTDEDPNSGFVIVNVDLPPLCSPQFKSGPPSVLAQELSCRLTEILDNSKCMDKTELCIEGGKHVWCLYCDVTCLDYDGSVLDAGLMAAVAALKTVRLPNVTFDKDSETLQLCKKTFKNVTVSGFPTAVSFAMFDDSNILSDPTSEEELLSNSLMTIAVDKESICGIYHAGGTPISDVEQSDLIEHSLKRSADVKRLLELSIKKK